MTCENALREIFERLAHDESLLALTFLEDESKTYFANTLSMDSASKEKYSFVFFDPETFRGNSKYLYLFMAQNFSKLGIHPPLWLTSNNLIQEQLNKEGLPVRLWKGGITEWPTVIDLLNSSALVSDTFHPLPSGSKILLNHLFKGKPKFNLWHGIGPKKVGYSGLVRMDASTALSFASDLLSMTHFVAPHYRDFERYDQGKKNFIKAPFSRNIVFFEDEPMAWVAIPDSIRRSYIYNLEKYTDTVVYAPSWAKPEFTDFEKRNRLHLESIQGILAANPDCFVYVKFHDLDTIFDDVIEVLNTLERVCILDSKFDIQPFLSKATALVTDYSSIAFDMLFSNAKIVFLQFMFPSENIDFHNNTMLEFPAIYVQNVEELNSLSLPLASQVWNRVFTEKMWGSLDKPDLEELTINMKRAVGRQGRKIVFRRKRNS